MNKLLAVLFTLLAPIVVKAAGVTNTLGMFVESNGWVLCVIYGGTTTSSPGTNLNYYTGFLSSNNIPSFNPDTNTFKLTVSSPGRNKTTTGTVVRTFYPVRILRGAYPLSTFDGSMTNQIYALDTLGTNVICKFALSDYIRSNDTVTASMNAGAVQNTNTGAHMAAVSSMTVTNSSQQTYPKVISNWAGPGYNRETNSVLTLRVVAFHSSGYEGRPVESVTGIVRDESGNAMTNTVTEMSVDWSWATYGLPIGEYIIQFPNTIWTNGSRLRYDYIASARIGPASLSDFSTLSDTYTFPTRLPAAQSNVCDRLRTWGGFIAVVGTNNVASAVPAVTNITDPTLVSTANYFSNFTTAASAMQAYNNANASPTHNDCGGGILYGRIGITNFAGASLPLNTARAVIEIRPYPGEVLTITSRNSGTMDGDIAGRVKFVGVNFNVDSTQIPLRQCEFVVFDNCKVTNSALTFSANGIQLWFIHSVLDWKDAAPFYSQDVTDTTSWMFRDCQLEGFTFLKLATCLGVIHRTTSTIYTVGDSLDGMTTPSEYTILYGGAFYGQTGGGNVIEGGSNPFRGTIGSFIGNCIFEKSGNTAQPAGSLWSSGTGLDRTNDIIVSSILIGERLADLDSNSTGIVTNKNKIQQFRAGNVFDLTGYKLDFTGSTPTNARAGDWGSMYSVGDYGMVHIECMVNTAAGGFPPDYDGINSYHPKRWGTITFGTNIVDYARWTDRKAYTGNGFNASGFGNYRPLHTSPLHNMGNPYLPFDIEGKPYGRRGLQGFKRGTSGPSASGDMRKGDFN